MSKHALAATVPMQAMAAGEGADERRLGGAGRADQRQRRQHDAEPPQPSAEPGLGPVPGLPAYDTGAQLGIERSEAGEYIKTYFARFPGIGPRLAKRFVYHLLNKSPASVKEFAQLIEEVKRCIDAAAGDVPGQRLAHPRSWTI